MRTYLYENKMYEAENIKDVLKKIPAFRWQPGFPSVSPDYDAWAIMARSYAFDIGPCVARIYPKCNEAKEEFIQMAKANFVGVVNGISMRWEDASFDNVEGVDAASVLRKVPDVKEYMRRNIPRYNEAIGYLDMLIEPALKTKGAVFLNEYFDMLTLVKDANPTRFILMSAFAHTVAKEPWFDDAQVASITSFFDELMFYSCIKYYTSPRFGS